MLLYIIFLLGDSGQVLPGGMSTTIIAMVTKCHDSKNWISILFVCFLLMPFLFVFQKAGYRYYKNSISVFIIQIFEVSVAAFLVMDVTPYRINRSWFQVHGTATVVLLVIFYLVGKLTDAGKFDILAFK